MPCEGTEGKGGGFLRAVGAALARRRRPRALRAARAAGALRAGLAARRPGARGGLQYGGGEPPAGS